MKLSEFILLTQQEKRSVLLQDGEPVARRYLLNKMVFLFQLPDYYVETFCCLDSKEIREFRIFHDTSYLAPYLEQISIDHLFE